MGARVAGLDRRLARLAGTSVASGWLDALVLLGGWQATFAVVTMVAIHFVLCRAVLDMLTDLRDFYYRHRVDPLRGRFATIDGKLAWGTAAVIVWTHIESFVAASLMATLVVGMYMRNDLGDVEAILSKNAHQWWSEVLGFFALILACWSVLIRNSNPVFPLPYRWLGLARNATRDEAIALHWPWTRGGA
jgi:hypothetical protein